MSLAVDEPMITDVRIDAAGNVERKARTRNLKRFSVR